MKNILAETLDALLADTKAQGNPLRAALQSYRAALDNRDKLLGEQAKIESLLKAGAESTAFDDEKLVAALVAAPTRLKLLQAQFTGHEMTGELMQATADLRREIAEFENGLLERMAALRAKVVARLAEKARKSFGVADDGTNFLWLGEENRGQFEGDCLPPYQKLNRAETVARTVFAHTPAGVALLKLPQSACYRYCENPIDAAQSLLTWSDGLTKAEKLAAAL
jgi:hypothetical protein